MTYLATTKPIKIECKTHEDWLQHRTDGIGSSDIATVVGLNPYKTPYELWLEKTGQEIKEKDVTFAMKAGHYLEDAVAKFFEDESRKTIIQSSASEDIYVHHAFDWARVSPDRTYWLTNLKNDDKGILECKTTQMTIDPEELPPYWFTQLQYQLGVMNRVKGSLAWLSAGRSFDYRELDFVPDYFNWIMEEADKFVKDNIIGMIEPPLVNASDVILKYRKHTDGTFYEASDDLAAKVMKLKELKDSIKASESEQKLLEDEIKIAISDAEALTYQGNTLVTWKAAKDSQRFNQKAFEAEKPELFKNYMQPVQGSRRFLVK